MLTQIRHIQKGTLIVVTIVIVISFAFLYSDFDFTQGTVGRQNCVVKVYNRCYRLKEAQKLANHFDVALRLGMYDFASVLFGEDRRDEDRTNFMLSLVILRHEAAKLGIEPSAEEIKAAIPTLPVFQQSWVTGDFVKNNILGPNGFTDGDLAQLVKDYLAFQKLRELIGIGVNISPSEVEQRYLREHQRYTASLVRFDRKEFESKVDVSAEKIKASFEANADDFKSEPKRVFEIVTFTPKALPADATNEQKANAGREFGNAVNRAYADLAADGPHFSATAAAVVALTDKFTAVTTTTEAISPANPPKEIAENQEAITTIFSDALQVGSVTIPVATEEGGYAVYHYKEAIAPVPLTLEQATPAIKEAILSKESNRLVKEAAEAARTSLSEALASGKDLSSAAAGVGVVPVALPNFSAAEPPAEIEEASLIVEAVTGLDQNQVSTVVERPGGSGYLIVAVSKIELYEDENAEAEKRTLAAATENKLRNTLFTSWFNQRRNESKSEVPTIGTPVEEQPATPES